MQRPALDTLACVHAECPWFRHPGANHLSLRKVYGPDRIRLLRCRTCGEEFSERRGTALCNPKLPEGKAEAVITQMGEGCSVRATARLGQVATEPAARLGRVPGRHAQRCHDQYVHSLTPQALAGAEQWSVVKQSTLRHEIARLIVWQAVPTRPVVPSAISYEVMRGGNDPSRALGHGTHSLLTGACTVRERCLCQQQAETGLDGG